MAFIGFQGYEPVRHVSWGLVFLTLFDAFIVYLATREYQRHKARRVQSLRPGGESCRSVRVPVARSGPACRAVAASGIAHCVNVAASVAAGG